ncbi:hypothetical protein SPBR_02568 [Sporothrix brasiliensis 5110]|uniref:Rhodopsin domain-containing protein n=1 Tax=Sporothrix brasiliensis 5110 TaxID=1398154 RepID=A0A0C2J0K6_9PEZI|nr:uncharacterized protein SPBR_02568 [Sporothrix brasiliensis 5110]KIH92525.1 hypothetical protein SPBR_02568 [Sporothrix brasiliensis 5110]
MSSFTTEAFTLFGIGFGFIMLRTYARLSKTGMFGFKADDYLMLVAAVVYAAETVLAYSVGAYWHGMANSGMTDAERAALSPDTEEYRMRVTGSKTQVAGWSTYTLLLWLLKASMCSFYLRLTEGLDYRRRIYAGFGLIFATWVAVLLSILLGCRPMSKNWQIYPDPGNACQPAVSHINVFVTLVLNVLTDIYLMSIPLPMLWKANLRPAKKIGLMVLFSGGLFVTAAAILRCVLIITNPATSAQLAGAWGCRETFVAVVTSNAPMIFPLMRYWGGPLFSTMRSYSSRVRRSGAGMDGAAGNTGGIGRSVNGMFILEDKGNPRCGFGVRSVHPIPNMTFSESEEYIYAEQQQRKERNIQRCILSSKQQPSSGCSKMDYDVEQQCPAVSSSTGTGTGGCFDTGSAAVATVVPSGITKQVVLQITEEDGQRRRSTFIVSGGVAPGTACQVNNNDSDNNNDNNNSNNNNDDNNNNNASDADSTIDSRNSLDMLEKLVPGARQGNYFLTSNNPGSIQKHQKHPKHQQQRSSIINCRAADTNSLSTAATSVTSPLAAHSWDCKPPGDQRGDVSVENSNRGALAPSSRRR